MSWPIHHPKKQKKHESQEKKEKGRNKRFPFNVRARNEIGKEGKKIEADDKPLLPQR